MSDIKTVALYARVSTAKKKDPKEKQQSPEPQLRELRLHAQSKGWVVTKEYVDRASGAKDSRPALNQLMLDAQTRPWDAVMVWKLDRFGRSLKHLISSLEILAGWKVAFVSLRENLDLTTAAGRLMFQLIGAFAEFEREIIRERVIAGMANAAEKGTRSGKPIGRTRRPDIDVTLLRKLRASGMSWRRIAAHTGIPQATCRDRCAERVPELGVCA